MDHKECFIAQLNTPWLLWIAFIDTPKCFDAIIIHECKQTSHGHSLLPCVKI